MYAVVSLNDHAYQELADITWPNKVEYCQRHGYAAHNKTQDFVGVEVGYEKIFLLRDLMQEHPEYQWLWWTGCDTLITNYTIRIEDRIDDNYDFIVAQDFNHINVDSFLIKNSVWGRWFMQNILDTKQRYTGWPRDAWWYEQSAIIDMQPVFPNNIKLVPQRDMNSYEYQYFPDAQGRSTDRAGNDGNWQPGDWLCHWPAREMSLRIERSRFLLEQVVK
jgi:hypothetical protein